MLGIWSWFRCVGGAVGIFIVGVFISFLGGLSDIIGIFVVICSGGLILFGIGCLILLVSIFLICFSSIIVHWYSCSMHSFVS